MTPADPAQPRRWSSLLASVRELPAKALVTGGIGTGKSSLLAEVRNTLRSKGVDVRSRPPEAGDPAAVVVDDAHLLSPSELGALTDLVSNPGSTVIVATEAREHDAALRALMAAVERENPRVVLGPLSRADVPEHMAELSPADVEAVLSATAGIPFLVTAALASRADPADAAQTALTERLRRIEQPILEALLVASLSLDLGPTDVAAALGLDLDLAQSLVASAHATGLLSPAHGATLLSTVHSASARIVGTARHHDIETALLRSQLDMGTLAPDLALRLAEHGVRSPALATVLSDEAARTRARPEVVARLLRAAADAGSDTPTVALADALALTGDCAAAAALADDLLTSQSPDERSAAVRVAAAVAAHDGDVAHAAELFGWVGTQADAVLTAGGVVAHIGAGNAPAARDALGAPTGPPTAAARAARSLAEGLLTTVEQSYPAAAVKLGQALGPEKPATEALLDTPAALVSLAALHAGDALRARSVLARAQRTPEPVMFAHRHRLLSAWVKMQEGHLSSASAEAAGVPTTGLHRRDALWAAALRTGLARRSGDAGALHTHWSAAMDVLTEYSIDLYSLLPLGELWVAAARLRQGDRLNPQLEQAFAVLTALGKPSAWSLPLHWAGVHAAILTNSPEALAPHGQALTAAGTGSDFARALAVAGRSWLRVLARQVDVDDVTAAARGLAQFGLTWDATRLAGQAALQAPDPRVSGAMLQIARDLKLTTGGPEPDTADGPVAPSAPATAPSTNGSPLSEREREVAELLVLGMPYKDIGSQLFISAKTVEHHVARIRRRLGAESRSEMLSMLRALLSSQN
jgi:DNA-binding CsgD family transcriptional regulator